MLQQNTDIYDRFRHSKPTKTGKAKQPTMRTVGIPIAINAINAASTTGVNKNTLANIEPRTSQRNNGRFGHNLYLQPNIEYFA